MNYQIKDFKKKDDVDFFIKRSESHLLSPEETLWNIFCQCPGWKSKWRRMIEGLQNGKNSDYRHFNFVVQIKFITVTSRQNQSVFSINIDWNQFDLFIKCHSDILFLLETYYKTKKMSLTSHFLKSALLTQWPTDSAWHNFVKSDTCLSLAFNTPFSHRYLPRLLAERKQALVLIFNDNKWCDKNGAALKDVLKISKIERQKVIRLLTNIPTLTQIELPNFLTLSDYSRLLSVLRKVKKGLKSEHHLITQAVADGKKWKLAFRRIQGMGFNGVFDSVMQTVIVDPRHMESITHELCHWLLGHGDNLVERQNNQNKEMDVHILETKLFGVM